jgi:hypothetical protein
MEELNMNDKKQLIIQVPDEIIRNTNFKLDSHTFATYTYLKFLHFRNYFGDVLELDHNAFKGKLCMADNRTLKKCLLNLHKQGIVLEYIDKLPKQKALTLTFDPVPFESKTFTQLPANILYKIEHIGVIGLRLLFYYESYINRADVLEKQFAFPAIETIAKDLNINKETVIEYNSKLKKNKLIKIIKHKLEWSGDYDNLDAAIYTKYNNHYYVQINNI